MACSTTFGKVRDGTWACPKLQRTVTLLIPRSFPSGSWGCRHPSAWDTAFLLMAPAGFEPSTSGSGVTCMTADLRDLVFPQPLGTGSVAYRPHHPSIPVPVPGRPTELLGPHTIPIPHRFAPSGDARPGTCLFTGPGGGGGMSSETHPPPMVGVPQRSDNVPHPREGGGGGLLGTHPPTASTDPKAQHRLLPAPWGWFTPPGGGSFQYPPPARTESGVLAMQRKCIRRMLVTANKKAATGCPCGGQQRTNADAMPNHVPPTPHRPEGTLGYCTGAQVAGSTKRRKKNGSSVAYKTQGAFLPQE